MGNVTKSKTEHKEIKMDPNKRKGDLLIKKITTKRLLLKRIKNKQIFRKTKKKGKNFS